VTAARCLPLAEGARYDADLPTRDQSGTRVTQVQ